ncbi:FeoA family protein [Neorhodopirellula lusitana]|nr:ferrous iron transport protein A [Neorhodopirellula lusitana]
MPTQREASDSFETNNSGAINGGSVAANGSVIETSLNRFRGTCGQITRLDVPAACATRLKSLGLFEGQRVQLARGGNPMIVKAAGGKIAVAGEIARGIFLSVAPS